VKTPAIECSLFDMFCLYPFRFSVVQSGGHPLRYLYRAFGTAVLRAVPRSIVDAQLDKAKADIAKGVIGDKMDGETVYKKLPAEGSVRPSAFPRPYYLLTHALLLTRAGIPKAELYQILERYAGTDRACWDTGKVRAQVPLAS
jgi:hypothetical protein